MKVVLVLVLSYMYMSLLTDVHGLHCWKCMIVDCDPADLNCERITSFIHSELEPYYFFDGKPPQCPASYEENDAGQDWTQMQLNDAPCPSSRNDHHATCTMGRMQVKTFRKDAKGNVSYNHATVLGCAKLALIARIYHVSTKKGQMCDYIIKKKTFPDGIVIQLEMEHCRHLSTECHKMDYCIDWKKSKVKPWKENKSGNSVDSTSVVIRLLVSLVFVAFGVVILVFCGMNMKACVKPLPERGTPDNRNVGEDIHSTPMTVINHGNDGGQNNASNVGYTQLESSSSSIEGDASANPEGTAPPPSPVAGPSTRRTGTTVRFNLDDDNNFA